MTVSQVSRLADVEVHIIRYWVREFSDYLKPRRAKGGQRIYSDSDVQMILKIKRLMQDEMFSIAGVRKALESVPWLY